MPGTPLSGGVDRLAAKSIPTSAPAAPKPIDSRNQRSVAIDLKHKDGIAVLHRLAATVDVFVTNFPLPVRDRLKLSPGHLMPLNPRLIYASFTAYGEAGEEAEKPPRTWPYTGT
jgi:crotonobetainyl-CoA:carnitine CoA-transferase CaiB-like acyl-CoA transferase